MLLIKCEENGSIGKKLVNFTKKLMNFSNFLVHSSKVYSTNNFAKTNKIVTLSVVCNFPHSVDSNGFMCKLSPCDSVCIPP